MSDIGLSRRDALRTIGGTLLAGTAALAADDTPADVAVIDTHVHLVESRLPGGFEKAIPLAPFDKSDPKAPRRLARTFEDEAKKAGVAQALCMPRLQVSDKDPLGIQDALAIIKLVRGVNLHPVGLAHPERFDQDHMARVEEVL